MQTRCSRRQCSPPPFQSPSNRQCRARAERFLLLGSTQRSRRRCTLNTSVRARSTGPSASATLSAAKFVGGMTGRYIQAFLDEKKIEHVSITVPKATRTCTTVLDKRTGDMTELIEPAARIESREREELELTAKELLAHSPSMEAIALCGTLPPGITGSTYTLMAQLNQPTS
ncbi:hypothetical protein BC831DRAFT_200513 [Entophlyctis helioformis]|nr:hypothetical protein BC831DRAFT_200513 [Entophlyctis helioformis]